MSPSVTTLLGGALLLLFSPPSSAYDIGCVYPEATPEPWTVREMLSNWGSEAGVNDGMETPMVIRGTYYWGTCQAMCLHLHDPRVNDPFTGVPLGAPLPAYVQNAFSITMCMVQCDIHLVEAVRRTLSEEFKQWTKDTLKIEGVTLPSEAMEVKEAVDTYYNNGDPGPVGRLVLGADYDPLLMGHVAGFRVMLIHGSDGWNADGSLQYSSEADGAVPCTGSCRKFQDTSGYAPQPNPRTYPDLDVDDDKYACTGLCRRWQPLQEGNEVGSLKQQEFVVPHIGQNAVTYLRPVTTTLADPEYDIYEESLLVIEQLRVTAGDDYRKEQVRIMDDKLHVRYIIRVAMREQFGLEISYQDYLLFILGISVAEYDAVVHAWHEKKVHDYVRPTTFIKNWDADPLFTFGGDVDHPGPVEIAARDFEALIRVMPHPEFPSGSSCLCTAYMEFVDKWTKKNLGGRTLGDFTAFGTEYANMTELRDICSESRLWGGMHFRAAVPAGIEVCEGLGTLGLEFIDDIKDDSVPFEGEFYYRGDDRPQCGEP